MRLLRRRFRKLIKDVRGYVPFAPKKSNHAGNGNRFTVLHCRGELPSADYGDGFGPPLVAGGGVYLELDRITPFVDAE